MRVHNGGSRPSARCKRRAAIKAKPAHPEQACAHHGERRAVRGQQALIKAAPRAQQHGDDKGGNARGRMHHNATGKIQCGELGCEPPAAPDPAGNGNIDQQCPQS